MGVTSVLYDNITKLMHFLRLVVSWCETYAYIQHPQIDVYIVTYKRLSDTYSIHNLYKTHHSQSTPRRVNGLPSIQHIIISAEMYPMQSIQVWVLFKTAHSPNKMFLYLAMSKRISPVFLYSENIVRESGKQTDFA